MKWAVFLVSLTLFSQVFSSVHRNDRTARLQENDQETAHALKVVYWSAPNFEWDHQVLDNLRFIVLNFGSDLLDFRPFVYIQNGTALECGKEELLGNQYCEDHCVNGNRYCALDNPDDQDHPNISGSQLVIESLRRTCVWRIYAVQKGLPGLYWNYITELRSSGCDLSLSEECLDKVMDKTGIEADSINACFEESGGIGVNATKNRLLEKLIRSSHKYDELQLEDNLPMLLLENQPLAPHLVQSAASIFDYLCTILNYQGRQAMLCQACSSCQTDSVTLRYCLEEGECPVVEVDEQDLEGLVQQNDLVAQLAKTNQTLQEETQVEELQDERIQLVLWTAPNFDWDFQMMRMLQPVVIALGKEIIDFQPRMLVRNGTSFCNSGDSCQNMCINHNRYCAVTNDEDLDHPTISGSQIVQEGLRRMCLWRIYNNGIHHYEQYQTSFWDYGEALLSKSCDQSLTTACLDDVFSSLNIHRGSLEDCIENSGGANTDMENSILQSVLEQAMNDRVADLPQILVNGVSLPVEDISTYLVFQKICSVLSTRKIGESSIPALCSTCSVCSENIHTCLRTGECTKETTLDEETKESDGIYAEKTPESSLPTMSTSQSHISDVTRGKINKLVEVTYWSAPNWDWDHKLLDKLKYIVNGLGPHELKFTLFFFVLDGHEYCKDGTKKDYCDRNCVNGNRYCAYLNENDHDHVNMTGIQIVEESLRRFCLWKTHGISEKRLHSFVFWDYIEKFSQFGCENSFSAECVEEAFRSVNVVKGRIDECMTESGMIGNDEQVRKLNTLMGRSKRIRIQDGLPQLLLQAHLMKSSKVNSEVSIFREICAVFNDVQPQLCTICLPCDNLEDCLLQQKCASEATVEDHELPLSNERETAAPLASDGNSTLDLDGVDENELQHLPPTEDKSEGKTNPPTTSEPKNTESETVTDELPVADDPSSSGTLLIPSICIVLIGLTSSVIWRYARCSSNPLVNKPYERVSTKEKDQPEWEDDRLALRKRTARSEKKMLIV